MPVPEADVSATLKAAAELVKEQTKLGLSGEASTFDVRINREVITGRDDRPVPGNLHRHRSVHSPNLSNSLVDRH